MAKKLWTTQRELHNKVNLLISFQRESLKLGLTPKNVKNLYICKMHKLLQREVHQIIRFILYLQDLLENELMC